VVDVGNTNKAMIGATNIERNLDLSYSLDKVKTDILRVVQNGGYALQNANHVFHTFRIGKLSGLEMAVFNITLKELDTEKTNIHIVVTEQIRSDGHKIIIDKMIDAFLERLSKALVGMPDAELTKVSAENSGCFGIAALMIATTTALMCLL
jgi:hypothetical protein